MGFDQLITCKNEWDFVLNEFVSPTALHVENLTIRLLRVRFNLNWKCSHFVFFRGPTRPMIMYY